MLITEPRDLLLLNNDLVIGTDLSWSRGVTGVIQECRIKLQMFQGEWFLDLDKGIPYWGQIFGQKPAVAIAAAGANFTEALMTVEDVIAVTKMNVVFDRPTRNMLVNWQVRCTFGQTPVDALLLPI